MMYMWLVEFRVKRKGRFMYSDREETVLTAKHDTTPIQDILKKMYSGETEDEFDSDSLVVGAITYKGRALVEGLGHED